MAIDGAYLPVPELTSAGIAVLPPDFEVVGERTAPSYEFTWMLSGAATAILGGVEHDLPQGSALLIFRGDRIDYRYHQRATGMQSRHAFVTFHLPTPPPASVRSRLLPRDGLIATILDHVIWLDAARPDGWRAALEQAFGTALRAFVDGNDDLSGSVLPRVSPVVARAFARIVPSWPGLAEVLPTPTLDELADAAGVSTEYLSRMFVREIGVAPIRALRLLRLERAASLLSRTTLPIAEVARLTGFVNEFHFSRTFKAQTGLSPSAYRADGMRVFDLPPGVHRLRALLDRG